MSRRRRQQPIQTIPKKANRLLNLILLAFILIILRVWHLTVVQHEEREEHALKPQRRTIIESAKRGTIRDRFNLPLAVNRLQYNAALLYSPLREIPSMHWEKTSDGKKVKHYPRKEYIAKLAHLFAEKLSLEPEYVEDLIHSKGALYNQIPFVIKEDLNEKEYYSLRALEKDWPGIQMQRVPRRFYPQGKVGCDIIGYLGAINRHEYEAIIEEMSALQNYIAVMELDEELPLPEGFSDFQQVLSRLKELKAKSYTLTDRVGKAGIEARYERNLRGSSGKKSYRSDARGNLLKELPGGHSPLSGQRVLLSISAELQAYAEELLIQNERIRETRATRLGAAQKRYIASKKPWIKGGAVVVLDPHSGEILALASHPRYDPNDFIHSGDQDINRKKRSNIMRWLEAEGHIADLWDQRRPMERELYDVKQHHLYEQQKMLSWNSYLCRVLAKDCPLMPILNKMTVPRAHKLITSPETAFKQAPFSKLSPSEQELCLDLCRMMVNESRFDEALCSELRHHTLTDYRRLSAAFGRIQEAVHDMTKELYHDQHFALWRKQNEKAFLSQKRKQEKAEKRYAKPYIDLLNAEETLLYKAFWEEHKWQFYEVFLCGRHPSAHDAEMLPYFEHFQSWHDEIAQGAHQQTPWHTSYSDIQSFLRSIAATQRTPYLQTFRSYSELTRPLIGKYPQLRNYRGTQLEKDLAAAFYPRYGLGYGRSQAYRQSAQQGSIFKLVVAYEALIQKYRSLKENVALTPLQLNPLEITDSIYSMGKETFVGYTASGKPIPRFYKGGRIPRSTSKNLGKMGILQAIETSSNPYFSLLAGDILHSPNDLAEVARLFSYGERTGIDLPGEIAGKIPTDLETNRTGLYAMAIGQHSLVVTPLQASVMLAALANGGKILKPNLVKAIITPAPKLSRDDTPPTYTIQRTPTIEKRSISLPPPIQKILLEGMHRVVLRSQADSLQPLSRLYRQHPEAIHDYIKLKDQLIGKTSTAEVIERIDLDLKKGINMYNHVWFGGISYSQPSKETAYVAKDPFGIPEVVVIVYLRFGGFGKESAPMAAQLVVKWREIKGRFTAKRDGL